jgi:hypothetical protein
MLLAGWLSQDKGVVHSLAVGTPPPPTQGDMPAGWVAASAAAGSALTDALKQQAAAAGPLRNLQLLSWASKYLGSAGAVLNCVPAGKLTKLHCCLDWKSTADIVALCSLTALRSLTLQALDLGEQYQLQQAAAAGSMLTHLSALQQLTSLDLASPMCRLQLQHLPQLPQLQQLQAHITGIQPGMNLGHLTALSVLVLSTGQYELVLRPEDTLPRNVRRLCLTGGVDNLSLESSSECHWGPLLALRKLEHLEANMRVDVLQQTSGLTVLTSLTGLSSVQVLYQGYVFIHVGKKGVDLAAWRQLPIKVLCIAASQINDLLVEQLSKVHGLKEFELMKWPLEGGCWPHQFSWRQHCRL